MREVEEEEEKEEEVENYLLPAKLQDIYDVCELQQAFCHVLR